MIITEYELGYNRENIVQKANEGNVTAQKDLAGGYLSDNNALIKNVDWDKGLYWFRRAAENGSFWAFRCLKSLKENPEDRTFGGKFPTSKKLLKVQSCESNSSFLMSFEEGQKYIKKVHERRGKELLMHLIEYCQDEGRAYPKSQHWNKIYHDYSWYTNTKDFTKFPPLKAPLLIDTWNASENDRRLRLLTQIYWCYVNNKIGNLYNSIISLKEDDWHYGDCESTISLDLIKNEYASWLGVRRHPKSDISNHCTDNRF